MKTSLIKFALGSLAALALAIAPAQAVMINQLNNGFAESATNKINPDASYGSWLVWPDANLNVWNSSGLGVGISGNNTATSSGGWSFTTDGTGGTFNLNLSAFNAIQISAKGLSPSVTADVTAFNVNFFSGNATNDKGTTLSFSIASPTADWATVSAAFSTGSIAYGCTSQVDWANVTSYQIQGNYAAPAAFGMQYTDLQAVPEPATWALMGIAGGVLLAVRRSRNRRES
jgi:hypothetical protein